MRSLATAALLFLWVSAAIFTVHAEQKLTDISYTIKARLSTQAKKIFGEEKLRFKNDSGSALRVLYLHLRPNRLKEGSIQARTMGVKNFDSIFPYGPADAYLLVQELQLDGHKYEIGADAQLDDTILKLNLASPIDSGNYGEFSIKFVLKIPNGLERLGYFNENYYISWWYPELAVLDSNSWHHDPFEEPYQNFGSYSVELTVPEAMVVGATGGFPESEVKNNDGTKTLKFSAQNVHDFAWVADARYKVEETEWEGIKIRSLYLPENAEMGKLAARYSKDVLEYFSKRFGKYPYPTFTSAQINGLVAGAMEYPQLIMNGNLLYKFPKQSTLLDVVISHEVGHQWFFGMLMNNQPDETWLDEGFAEFAMIAYAEEKYGVEHNLADLKQIPEPWRDLFKNVISDWRSQFLLPNYLTTAREGREEIVTASPQKTRPAHTPLFYEKGALTLFALEYLVGRETFDKILQTYVQNFQFKQVTTADFEKVASDVYGQDLAWFFDEWLRSTKTLDFVFGGLIVEKAEGKYINRVLVHQAGEMH
ncbi:M1 family metallopeptidase, partial [Candidatus Acetothermia bacterium]|nr:M1 family metallopeptidase [Candidatus Acetothermia bacterium]